MENYSSDLHVQADIGKNSFNVLRMFLYIFGPSEAPTMLVSFHVWLIPVSIRGWLCYNLALLVLVSIFLYLF